MHFTGRSFLAFVTTWNINPSLTRLRGQGPFDSSGYSYALIALMEVSLIKVKLMIIVFTNELIAEMNSLSPKT